MATNKQPIFFNEVLTSSVQFTSAEGAVQKTALVVTADGGGVTNLIATTTDLATVSVRIQINDGTTINDVGLVTVPAGAGTLPTSPAKNLLDADDMPGLFQTDGSIALGPSSSILVGPESALSATQVMHITAIGGNYSDV